MGYTVATETVSLRVPRADKKLYLQWLAKRNLTQKEHLLPVIVQAIEEEKRAVERKMLFG